MKVHRAKAWSDLAPGQTIVFRSPTRRFIYRIETLVWANRSAEVSFKRKDRKQREYTTLFRVPRWIDEGRIWIKK